MVEVEKLKDNLFILKGGGNTGVFVMTPGVAVVDTKNPGWGQPILLVPPDSPQCPAVVSEKQTEDGVCSTNEMFAC
jgi:hypothetical protein